MSKRSAFRFVATTRGQRSTYSVWRGEAYLGFVQLRTSRITDRGVSHSFRHGWDPTHVNTHAQRDELPTTKTRDLAARALWERHMKS